MWAQSLGEYGAASTLVEAFTNLWVTARHWVTTMHPAWWIVPVVLLFLVLRRRR